MQIISPPGSFVQFSEMDTEHCTYGTVRATLPVLNENDVAFQIVVRGTEAEIDQVAAFGSDAATFAIIGTDVYASVLLEFSDIPERFRISTTDVLYNWTAGLPGFYDVVAIGECFRIGVIVNVNDEDQVFVSNLFERIGDDCFTAVLEYGSDDNGFGFNYCASSVDPDTGGGGEEEPPNPPGTCEPTRILFTNQSTLTIPYTAGLQSLYGATPTVQAWIYDETGELVNMGISIKMNGSPPTTITLDFGGNASGVVILRS